jgi:hypothetical protein
MDAEYNKCVHLPESHPGNQKKFRVTELNPLKPSIENAFIKLPHYQNFEHIDISACPVYNDFEVSSQQ